MVFLLEAGSVCFSFFTETLSLSGSDLFGITGAVVGAGDSLGLGSPSTFRKLSIWFIVQSFFRFNTFSRSNVHLFLRSITRSFHHSLRDFIRAFHRSIHSITPAKVAQFVKHYKLKGCFAYCVKRCTYFCSGRNERGNVWQLGQTASCAFVAQTLRPAGPTCTLRGRERLRSRLSVW